jgi:hypothetical protein
LVDANENVATAGSHRARSSVVSKHCAVVVGVVGVAVGGTVDVGGAVGGAVAVAGTGVAVAVGELSPLSLLLQPAVIETIPTINAVLM